MASRESDPAGGVAPAVLRGELVAALGALVLLGSLWLDWFAKRFDDAFAVAGEGVTAGGLTGWVAHPPIVDWLLLICALAGAGHLLGRAIRGERAQPPVIAAAAGATALVVIAICAMVTLGEGVGDQEVRVVTEARPGLWVGMVSAAAMLAGGGLAVRAYAASRRRTRRDRARRDHARRAAG